LDAQGPALARLTLVDLDGQPDTILFEDVPVVAGTYMVIGHVNRPYGTRVYQCRFTATDTSSDSTLFDASVYAVLWQPDADVAVLGWTGPEGTFQTADSLSFPNILSLPRLVRTGLAGPDSQGILSIPDSIAIALTDTTTDQWQITVHAITDGPNAIQITWAPDDARAPTRGRHAGDPVVRRLADGIPLEWKLYHPFPIPFN